MRIGRVAMELVMAKTEVRALLDAVSVIMVLATAWSHNGCFLCVFYVSLRLVFGVASVASLCVH